MSQYNPELTGSLAGVVNWRGARPEVPPFRSIDEPLTDKQPGPARDWVNPNAPVVTANRELVGAVVMLRNVDAKRARPWDHPPVRVELRDQKLRVAQQGESNVGFVRVGDPVEFVSRDDRLHVLQGRGDAFFALTLPRSEQVRVRRLDASGVVELTSGSGYFWMRAYLFVSDHPYLMRSDDKGAFRFDRVPVGEYDVVVWHPDWRVAREERNPDLFRVQQVRFLPALEARKRVRVTKEKESNIEMTLGLVK